MSLTKSELDLANLVEKEVHDYAAGKKFVNADQVIQSFRNVAIDFEVTVAQLPTNLWRVFHDFEQRPPTAIISIEEVIKKLKAA